MILNHVNLAVSDVQKAREFLMKYFGLDPKGLPGNDKIAILRDEQGMVLTLTNFEGATEVKYPGSFHIGFIQESPAKVDEMNARLKADGYEVDPPSRQHGSWTFYFVAPGGFVIEVLG
ncbi:MAG: VOC family protein [Paludisphaera borealis]|uniref:VOC family protein n=1 Tax=Paludisphaera borealis TaxID=1387353 RepID=UPI0028520695|nr:VOC family protein [Paludisphaera borealis]MDR3620243.1 VOC family protein [Paludisphaera borealis]